LADRLGGRRAGRRVVRRAAKRMVWWALRGLASLSP